jgi:hypothetical protein
MNPFLYFKSLIPRSVQIIAVVQSESAGYTMCLTLAGQDMKVLGMGGRASGSKVFVEIDPVVGARIIGDAPDLPSYDVTI